MNDYTGDKIDRKTYGDFQLTNAIQLEENSTIIPMQGYRVYTSNETMGVMIASITRPKILDIFNECLDLFGKGAVVDVVLETSHDRSQTPLATSKISPNSDDDPYYSGTVDLPVLQSHLMDYDDLLLDDGCTGIAIRDNEKNDQFFVELDEHKLLEVRPWGVAMLEKILRRHGIPNRPHMKFIDAGKHTHDTTDNYRAQSQELAWKLGLIRFTSDGHPYEDVE